MSMSVVCRNKLVRIRLCIRRHDSMSPMHRLKLCVRLFSSGSGRQQTTFPPLENLVYGIHPCKTLLLCKSRPVSKVYVLSTGLAVHDSGLVGTLRRIEADTRGASSSGLHIVRTDRDTLDRICRGATHQGIILVSEPIQGAELDVSAPPSPASGHPVLVAVGEINDPHNVGAILRSALLLGADGVVFTHTAQGQAHTLLGPTVAKTSAGALDVWHAARRLYCVPHLKDACLSLGSAGWRVLGTALPSTGPPHASAGHGASHATRRAQHIPFQDLSRASAAGTFLVLGNEGEGLRPALLSSCTHATHVPQVSTVQRLALGLQAGVGDRQGEVGEGMRLPVDSLNVAAATALLLHQLRPQ